MANHDDDGDDDHDVQLLDVSNAAQLNNPKHIELRDIAHGLTHQLGVRAVVLAVVGSENEIITSTMIHCSVADDEHPALGKRIIRGLRTCVNQIDRALCHGIGNRGRAPGKHEVS